MSCEPITAKEWFEFLSKAWDESIKHFTKEEKIKYFNAIEQALKEKNK